MTPTTRNGPVDLFEIDDSSGIPIWVQLRNRFIYLITSGHYRAGDQLPTVRGLASQIEISYNTVNKVYMDLEHNGYIRSRQGQGTFVCDSSAVTGLAEPTADVVTEEYIRRCIELGMTLDDIAEQMERGLEKFRRERGGQ